MENIKYPDYDNSILNLITSILKYYRVETNHSTLEELDMKLYEKDYKNVVLIILDGLGTHILNNIPSTFLKEHTIKTITSVYPSTTTAALTTYYSGKPPYETGWIAWSQYFKEFGRPINMLKHVESFTNNFLNKSTLNVFWDKINYNPIFEKIEEASANVKAYEITPDYSDKRSKRSLRANNIDELCENIELLCNSNGKKFIMAYSDNPDGLLHKYGCNSEEAKNMILNAEDKIEDLTKKINMEETLIIVSADHGHKDIEKSSSILDYPEIIDLLIMPPSLESRCLAFWVKEDKKEQFEAIFNDIFKDEFLLLKTEDALNMNLFGFGQKHKKIDDFLGNYLAISKSGSMIRLETYFAPGKEIKKSTHCGLTKEEMEVPLILI